MNRWAVRIIGILIVIVFALLMLNLQRQLLTLENERRQQKSTPSTAPR